MALGDEQIDRFWQRADQWKDEFFTQFKELIDSINVTNTTNVTTTVKQAKPVEPA